MYEHICVYEKERLQAWPLAQPTWMWAPALPLTSCVTWEYRVTSLGLVT